GRRARPHSDSGRRVGALRNPRERGRARTGAHRGNGRAALDLGSGREVGDGRGPARTVRDAPGGRRGRPIPGEPPGELHYRTGPGRGWRTVAGERRPGAPRAVLCVGRATAALTAAGS